MAPRGQLAHVTAALGDTLLRLQSVEADNIRLVSELADLRARDGTSMHPVDLKTENASLRQQIRELAQKLEVMNFRMAKMTRQLYGCSSEPYHPDQKVLDDLRRQIQATAGSAAGVTTPADTAVSTATDINSLPPNPGGTGTTSPKSKNKARTPRKKGRGRLKLPEHLPYQDVRIEVPEAERRGPDGQLLPEIGTEITWKIEYLPAWFRRLRILRPFYRIPYSDELRIIAPPLACVVPHGLPTDETVAMVLVEKYDFHCPLYRQETKLERAGIDISRATLMNWVRHGAEFLAPIHTAIGASIKTAPVIGMDDTWIAVLDPGAGKTHQSRLWGYYANDEFSCDYRRSREGKWPAEFLDGYTGVVMADAFSGHHQLFTSGLMTWAGCMAHARRKFEEALEAGESAASQAMDIFALLYELEHDIAMKPAGIRGERRKAEAVPVMDRLEGLITIWVKTLRPSSGLFIAARYTLKIFPQLRIYLMNERVPIDNNALERQWRQPSLNRKNSLFVGSDRGGAWAATMFSILQSCRLVNLDPYRYLIDIFAELHKGRIDYAALRPMAWSGNRKAQSA